MNRENSIQRLQERLGHWKNDLADFVCQLAAIESPSLSPESQQPLLDLLTDRLGELGCRT